MVALARWLGLSPSGAGFRRAVVFSFSFSCGPAGGGAFSFAVIAIGEFLCVEVQVQVEGVGDFIDVLDVGEAGRFRLVVYFPVWIMVWIG